MTFETEINVHKLVMDATGEFGGKDRGPRPKPLLIPALTGCIGSVLFDEDNSITIYEP